MAGVNKVILIGNLGIDPEVRVLESGVKVVRFTLATSESYRDKNSGERVTQTEWHNITLWRGLADVAEKYLQKGSQVYIEGKIKGRSWKDKEGIDRYSTDIIAENLTMLGKPSDNKSDSPTQNQQQDQENSSSRSAEKISNNDDSDDLPF